MPLFAILLLFAALPAHGQEIVHSCDMRAAFNTCESYFFQSKVEGGNAYVRQACHRKGTDENKGRLIAEQACPEQGLTAGCLNIRQPMPHNEDYFYHRFYYHKWWWFNYRWDIANLRQNCAD